MRLVPAPHNRVPAPKTGHWPVSRHRASHTVSRVHWTVQTNGTKALERIDSRPAPDRRRFLKVDAETQQLMSNPLGHPTVSE
jgi:hypothetical protein